MTQECDKIRHGQVRNNEQSLGFTTVEINYTYYRQPYAKTMAGLIKQ